MTPGVLDRLPHHRGESRRADRVGRDPEAPGRGAAVKLPRVDGKPKHEMGEDLLHASPGTLRHCSGDRGKAENRPSGPLLSHGVPGSSMVEARKAMRRTAASEKRLPIWNGGRRTPRPRPARSRLGLGATGIGLGGPSAEPRAIFGQWASAASGIAGAAEGRPDIHQRLGEITRPAARRQLAAPPLRFRLGREAIGALQGDEPRQNAGDIAVDNGAVWRPKAIAAIAAGGDMGANPGKRAQFGLLTRKSSAAPGDFLGAEACRFRARE